MLKIKDFKLDNRFTLVAIKSGVANCAIRFTCEDNKLHVVNELPSLFLGCNAPLGDIKGINPI